MRSLATSRDNISSTAASPNLGIIWFQQNNLRLIDNDILLLAQERHEYLLPVFCFDSYYHPSLANGETQGGQFAYLPLLQIPKTGPFKTKFLLESVENLRENLARSHQRLIIRKGKPEEVITSLAIECGAKAVYCNSSDSFDEIQTIDLVQRRLGDHRIDLVTLWGNTLYNLTDLPFHFRDNFPTSASAFRTICEKNLSIREPISLRRRGDGYEIRPPPPNVINSPSSWYGDLPSLEELCPTHNGPLDNNPKSCLHFQGGETAGLQRLQEYFFGTDSLKDYFHTRNGLLGPNYSSKFSPWLATGCLSPRMIVSEIRRYEVERVKNKDTYWLILELHFRDYFKFYSLYHGAKLFYKWGPRGYRHRNKELVWNIDLELFHKWSSGQTGNPFVDANMRELNESGWMSNRGRQIVASYLTRDLCIDWRWGAMYFESYLIDHDPALNWGNWTYSAGVGSDPREDRYFLVPKQAQQYDPDFRFIHHWLEETKLWSEEKMRVALKRGLRKFSSAPQHNQRESSRMTNETIPEKRGGKKKNGRSYIKEFGRS